MGQRKRLRRILSILLAPVGFLAAVLWLVTAVSDLASGQDGEALQQLEESLRRSAVACYAAEGVYPPDLAYLEEHYGVQIDEKRFVVYYDAFAYNMMPDITVLEK